MKYLSVCLFFRATTARLLLQSALRLSVHLYGQVCPYVYWAWLNLWVSVAHNNGVRFVQPPLHSQNDPDNDQPAVPDNIVWVLSLQATVHQTYPAVTGPLVQRNTNHFKFGLIRTSSSTDWSFICKLAFGMCDIDLNSLLSLRSDALTKGHRYKTMQEHCTNNYRENILGQRVTPVLISLNHSRASDKLHVNK